MLLVTVARTTVVAVVVMVEIIILLLLLLGVGVVVSSSWCWRRRRQQQQQQQQLIMQPECNLQIRRKKPIKCAPFTMSPVRLCGLASDLVAQKLCACRMTVSSISSWLGCMSRNLSLICFLCFVLPKRQYNPSKQPLLHTYMNGICLAIPSSILAHAVLHKKRLQASIPKHIRRPGAIMKRSWFSWNIVG